jgi:hypothetical protein
MFKQSLDDCPFQTALKMDQSRKGGTVLYSQYRIAIVIKAFSGEEKQLRTNLITFTTITAPPTASGD